MSRRVANNKPTGELARRSAIAKAAKKKTQEEEAKEAEKRATYERLQSEAQMQADYQRQYEDRLHARKNPVNVTHNCPFFAFAMGGETKLLEEAIQRTMMYPEDNFKYKNIVIVKLPGSGLFAPLRLVDFHSGSTLLHFAALSNLPTVELLLQYGMTAFINARNKTGATPIFLAAGRGHLDIVKALVNRGASITSYTTEGSSILHSAVMSGNYDLVYYLLSLPQIEVNVDDDEFLTPLGLAITRVSELKKQLNEMDVLMKETLKSMMVDASLFIMDENEKVDARRFELGISNSDDTITNPDLKFMTMKDQQEIMAEMVAEHPTIHALKTGLIEGKKLLENFVKICEVLIKPPVFQLTVPEMIHEHRPAKVDSVARTEKEREDALLDELLDEVEIERFGKKMDLEQIRQEMIELRKKSQEKKENEKNENEKKENENGENDTITTTTTATTNSTTDDKDTTTNNTTGDDDDDVPAAEPIPTNDEEKIDENGEKIEKIDQKTENVENTQINESIQIFYENGKKYTRRPAQQITHAPDRSKIVHFAPYISYWMLLVETEELGLIRTCLETSEIDVNWTFPLGSTVKNATALHYAVDLANIELIKLLLEFGADAGAELQLSVSLEKSKDTALVPTRDINNQDVNNDSDDTNTNNEQINREKDQNQDGDSLPPPPTRTTKESTTLPNTPPIIDLGHKLLNALYSTITIDTRAFIEANSVTTTKLTTAVNSNQNSTVQKMPKKHIYTGFVSKQQGFTPLLAALYNQKPDIAKLLIKMSHSRCLGPTYLATHTLTPYPNLLTPELLESLPPKEIQKKLEEQKQKINDLNTIDGNEEVNALQIPKINSFMDLLRVLSPFLTINSSASLQEKYQLEMEQKKQKKLAKLEQKLQKEKEREAVESANGGDQLPKSSLDDIDTDDEKEDEKTLSEIQSSPKDTANSVIPDPLRVAINEGYDEVVHALLTLGVDTNTPYFQSNITMTKNRPLESLTGEQYEFNVSIELTDLGFTPLYNAIKSKNTAIVRQLLCVGSRLDLSLYTYLLQNGIDINKTYYLPLYNDNVDERFIDNKTFPQQLIRINFFSPTASLPPVIQSVQYHPDVLHMLVANDKDVLNNVTNENRNALHYSCDLNKPLATTYLISNDPLLMFHRENNGLTPLSLAVGADHAEICKIALTFMRRIRSPLVLYHPHRPVPVGTGEEEFDDEIVNKYYRDIDEKFEFYPIVEPREVASGNKSSTSLSSSSQSSLDDIDIDIETTSTTSFNDEDDQKHNDDDQNPKNNDQNDQNDKNNKNDEKNNKNIQNNFIRPFWSDMIVEQDQLPFVFNPTGFDMDTYKAYHQYITNVYYPTIEVTSTLTQPSSKTPIPTNTSTNTTITPFNTYNITYNDDNLFDSNKNQLQSQPLRWFGFDISCANILSFYYNIVNNPKDLTNEPLIETLAPFINQIGGIYGHLIRALRLAAATGSIFSFKQIAAMLVAYPQLNAQKSKIPTIDEIFSQGLTPLPILPYNLWVELIVPTEEQLSTIKATAAGYQLLDNNIVVDTHGFIARNVTYEYAAGFYKATVAKGMISTTRLCIPLIAYLCTEVLSSITKKGATFLLAEALGNQSLPLLHGLRGTTFIRCFHQFYMCNPLLFNPETQSFNFNGIIKNRTPSLPFTPFMKADLGTINIPMTMSTRHFIVSKKVLSERSVTNTNNTNKLSQDDQNDDDDNTAPPLLDKKEDQVYKPINVYQVPTFSPVHLAVINDHVALIRLLIGLSPFPDQEKTDTDVDMYTGDVVTSLDGDAEEDDGMPKSELVQVDENDQHGDITPTKALEDIMLQPQYTETLAALVKALNIIPENPNEMFTLGPDMDENAPKSEEQQKQMAMMAKMSQMAQEMGQDGDFSQMTPEQLQSTLQQMQDNDTEGKFDNDEIKAMMSTLNGDDKKKIQKKSKLDSLPPLLHVPQPDDPIFQLINRMALYPMEIITPATDTEVEKTETINTIVHPLHLCALHDLVDSTEVLIQYGAIIDVQDHDGNTPLHIAVRDGSKLVIDTLLTYNASVNIQNNLGNTPIHVAIQSGSIDLAKNLIEEFCPDLNVRNNDGKNVMELLQESEEKFAKFNSEELDKDLDLVTIDHLTHSGKVDKVDLTKMSFEERRRHNVDQIQMLRRELDKLRNE